MLNSHLMLIRIHHVHTVDLTPPHGTLKDSYYTVSESPVSDITSGVHPDQPSGRYSPLGSRPVG